MGVLPAVLAERVLVWESFYEQPRGDIASALGTLISSPGVEIYETAIHLDTLDRYRKTNVHFVDCLIAATASAENKPVSTFDQDFRKFVDGRVETREFSFRAAALDPGEASGHRTGVVLVKGGKENKTTMARLNQRLAEATSKPRSIR
jgi:predicted nucleic-acid-binding protein